MIKKFITTSIVSLALIACQPTGDAQLKEETEVSIDSVAEQYVKLTLAVGHHHDYYIDAYYGPEEWKPTEKESLEILALRTEQTLKKLASLEVAADQKLRFDMLQVQLKSVAIFIAQLQGKNISFDEESKGLYDAISPNVTYQDLDKALSVLSDLIPGQGDLNERVANFNEDFVIPVDKLDSVFKAAIDESRIRTKKHIDLPEQESFTIEYVTDKVWSGYNWYKGNNYSLIQLNTDFPIQIERAIDLASHEGYPGHHVFNSQMERNLVRGRGWIEYSVYPLFSPLSLLAEGSANYGIEVAFPLPERLVFEKEVLFPLAGLDATKVEQYYKVQAELQKLSYADNVIAKQYLDGEIDAEKAVTLLQKYKLSSEGKAKQRLGFIEANRSYVINYNLGQDIVNAYIDKLVGEGNHNERWKVFSDLLANPRSGSMMQ